MKKFLILFLLILPLSQLYGDYKTSYNGQLVTVYDWQVCLLYKNGYSKSDILDLMAIRTQECNKEDGQCISKTNDYGFFQINKKRHQKAVEKSQELWEDKKELFLYQANYVKNMLDRNRKNCENNFICLANIYNGSSKYGPVVFEKRKIIENYVYNLIKK